MTQARQNSNAIMTKYKERKVKLFQQQKEKLIEKQRAKDEAERKLTEQKNYSRQQCCRTRGPLEIRKGNQ